MLKPDFYHVIYRLKKKTSVILKAHLVVGQDDKGAATGRLHDDGQELRVHGTERRVP